MRQGCIGKKTTTNYVKKFFPFEKKKQKQKKINLKKE